MRADAPTLEAVAPWLPESRERFCHSTESEQEQAVARVVHVLAVLVYLALASRYRWDPGADLLFQQGWWLLGYALAWLALVRIFPARLPARRLVALLVDVLALSYAVWRLQALGLVFVPLYVAVTGGNGLRYGSRYLYAALGLSVLGFGLACARNPFWMHNRVIEGGMLASIAGIPPFLAILLRRAERANAHLRHLYTEMERLASHDVLTGLPNSKMLYGRLEQSLNLAERHGRVLAVLFLDLDNFKQINDEQGHVAADAVLKEVARRLSSCVRRSDLVARLGGDEFVIVLTELRQAQNTAFVAEKLIQTLAAQPVTVEGAEVRVTTSLGIAAYPGGGRTPEQLVRNADAAMYQAKQLGRNRYCVYDCEPA